MKQLQQLNNLNDKAKRVVHNWDGSLKRTGQVEWFAT